MTELELIIDLHRHTDRQGPGSNSTTLRALSFVDLPFDQTLKVADLGCGSGGPTLALASTLNAEVTAVDLFPEFLSDLNQRAKDMALQKSINCLEASIDDLPFEKSSLDLIWSEGAIYNIGFRHGLKIWKDFLKPKGFIAISEITWITSKRPQEIEDYWTQQYPEINLASVKIKDIEDAGYSLTGYYILSPDCWIKHYYEPLMNNFDPFLKKHAYSSLAQKVISDHKKEINLYQKYQEFYSYGFYIAQKK